jgi:hypothetical protein
MQNIKMVRNLISIAQNVYRYSYYLKCKQTNILQQFTFVFTDMSLCMIHNHKRHQLRYNSRHIRIFILYLPIKYDIPSSSGSLVISINWKDKHWFHPATILNYIPEKHKLCFLTDSTMTTGSLPPQKLAKSIITDYVSKSII